MSAAKPKPIIKITLKAKPVAGDQMTEPVKVKEVKVKEVKVKEVKVKVKEKAKAKAKVKEEGTCTEVGFPPLPEDKSKLVISFDVGIINLAYCVLEITDTGSIVYDWNIINLAGGDPKLTCSTTLQKKDKSKCSNKAFYIDTNGKGICLTHSKSFCAETLKRNLTVANVTEVELKERLFRALDANPIFLEPSIVLVEQQPLKGMEKIRGVGHALFDYFVLRGVIDRSKKYSVLKFIDAKNKLTVYEGPPISCHLKTQYARNKWYAIKYCAWAIEPLPYASHYFGHFGQKRDDLADCFLQGLWYIKYGAHGTKAPITSNHQKLVYRENHKLSYAKVRPHAPSKKSLASGKLTLSNIKYMIKRKAPIEGALKSSIQFYFGTGDSFSADGDDAENVNVNVNANENVNANANANINDNVNADAIEHFLKDNA